MGGNKAAFGLSSVVGRGTCRPTIMVTGKVGTDVEHTLGSVGTRWQQMKQIGRSARGWMVTL